MSVNPGFISLLILVAIHLFANQVNLLSWIWHGRFLSFAAGVSLAYVFVDLLPTLEKGQPVLQKTFSSTVPYLDHHAYLIALLGVLFYYGLHSVSPTQKNRSFWIEVSGYLLFNFFMGASLADSNNPDIQPIFFFTVAMGLHIFVHDHNIEIDHLSLFEHQVRWCIAASLMVGYLVGYLAQIPNAVVAIIVSFLAGGVLLNSLRYELPKRENIGYGFFVLGAIIYTALLLNITICLRSKVLSIFEFF